MFYAKLLLYTFWFDSVFSPQGKDSVALYITRNLYNFVATAF